MTVVGIWLRVLERVLGLANSTMDVPFLANRCRANLLAFSSHQQAQDGLSPRLEGSI